MALSEAMQASSLQTLCLDGHEVSCRLVRSKTAKKLWIRIRSAEVEVVVPRHRDLQEGLAFVIEHQPWVIKQLERARRLLAIRRPEQRQQGCILYRGAEVPIRVIRLDTWRGPNRVTLEHDILRITTGAKPPIAPSRSLENWLRKQARERIEHALTIAMRRLNRVPNRIYIMDQRTKWGSCSGLANLSFNWRLIMAPDYVLGYIVTHEMVHLAIPDHSRRFWLTVQSLFPDMDQARQWLVANGHRLAVDLSDSVAE